MKRFLLFTVCTFLGCTASAQVPAWKIQFGYQYDLIGELNAPLLNAYTTTEHPRSLPGHLWSIRLQRTATKNLSWYAGVDRKSFLVNQIRPVRFSSVLPNGTPLGSEILDTKFEYTQQTWQLPLGMRTYTNPLPKWTKWRLFVSGEAVLSFDGRTTIDGYLIDPKANKGFEGGGYNRLPTSEFGGFDLSPDRLGFQLGAGMEYTLSERASVSLEPFVRRETWLKQQPWNKTIGQLESYGVRILFGISL